MADSEVENEAETKAGAGVYFFWARHLGIGAKESWST